MSHNALISERKLGRMISDWQLGNINGNLPFKEDTFCNGKLTLLRFFPFNLHL